MFVAGIAKERTFEQTNGHGIKQISKVTRYAIMIPKMIAVSGFSE